MDNIGRFLPFHVAFKLPAESGQQLQALPFLARL